MTRFLCDTNVALDVVTLCDNLASPIISASTEFQKGRPQS